MAALLGSVASAQQPEPRTTLGIGLVDVPAEANARSRAYIVEHVAPGDVFSRRVQVSNLGTEPIVVHVYVTGAQPTDGSFQLVEDVDLPIQDWIDPQVREVSLAPTESRIVDVAIAVPDDTAEDEYFAAVFAEIRDESESGITTRSRVGIRVYLSVGPGGEPASNFSIVTMTAQRGESGAPVVDVEIVNTGGRAVDVTGTLDLLDGPGGLRAGPFDAENAVTLDVGQRAPVRFVLDPSLPAGPWRAHTELRSGLIERAAEATIVFPEAAGDASEPVEATEVPLFRDRGFLLPVAVALVILLVVLFSLFWWFFVVKRRKDDDEDEDTRKRKAKVGG